MRKWFFGLLLLTVVSCSRQEQVAQQDSILAKPQVTYVDTIRPQPNGTGLIVDSLHATPKDREAILARFSPKDILQVYHDYKPLRKASVTEPEIDQFASQHKITRLELKTVLAEGDRLGWSK